MSQSRRQFVQCGISAAVTSALLLSPVRVTAKNVDFDVPGSFPVLKQVGDTCWATTGTMMYNWKHTTTNSVDEVTKMAGDLYALLYSQKVALTYKDKPGFLSFFGMKAEPPASYPPQAILNLVKKYGLLWTTTLISVENCKFSTHARVVRGIHGDDSSLDKTTLTIVDPATGTQSQVSMKQFYKDFEDFAAGENNCDPQEPLQPQIFHFA